MSPAMQSKKISVPDNIYTVILGLAFVAVLATAAFVAYKCSSQFGSIF